MFSIEKYKEYSYKVQCEQKNKKVLHYYKDIGKRSILTYLDHQKIVWFPMQFILFL